MPWGPSKEQKPAPKKGVVVAGGGQVVPPDPEILMLIDEETVLAQWLPKDRMADLIFAEAMWMGCLRERHLQRSLLTKLGVNFIWGVCTKGKNKPGFAWGMPRYSPAGFDIGGALWSRWKEWSLRAGEALLYAAVGEDGQMLKPGGAADAVRFLLSKHGIRNPEVFTMRGMRRVQPTILGQRGAPEAERVAVGDWQACSRRDNGPQVASMPVLYEGDKVRTAAYTKMIQMLCVRKAAAITKEKLDWRRFRSVVRALPIQAIQQEADRALEDDDVVDEIPKELVPNFVTLDKQFFFPRDSGRLVIQQVKYDMDEVRRKAVEQKSPSPEEAESKDGTFGVAEVGYAPPAEEKQEQEEQPRQQSFVELMVDVPRDACWAMTARKVHILPTSDAPPWCAQRKGARAKRLQRVAAEGSGLELLLSLGIENQVDLCVDCLAAFRK